MGIDANSEQKFIFDKAVECCLDVPDDLDLRGHVHDSKETENPDQEIENPGKPCFLFYSIS